MIVTESPDTTRRLLSHVRASVGLAGPVRQVRPARPAPATPSQATPASAAIGFVPTMGALHAGHESLIRRSVAECDFTVVSNFVNPLQFSPQEDLAGYPRDLKQDNQICRQLGVDLVFAPAAEEMFPNLDSSSGTVSIRLGELTRVLEGEHRPGHLEGVAAVVAKLLNIVGGCRAYFGEKDWQQLCVVRRLAAELSLPAEVVGCETVREPDGLALSSRNRYLTDSQRRAAPVLHRALCRGAELAGDGLAGGATRSSLAEAVGSAMADMILDQPEVESLDYAVLVNSRTLTPPTDRPPTGPINTDENLRLLVAARIGRARLIDNLAVSPR